ncbi:MULTISPECIES: hypothetical protein [unclassified Streptomyces]|nr:MULTISPECIES: hypothetical protein [unclassified Streptomyces]MCX4834624.1 hypothetical protein [Streptomyces sp. NBC_01016]
MAGILNRIKQYSRSPQGRRTIARARRTASDPRRQAQARGWLARLRRR